MFSTQHGPVVNGCHSLCQEVPKGIELYQRSGTRSRKCSRAVQYVSYAVIWLWMVDIWDMMKTVIVTNSKLLLKEEIGRVS